MQISLSAPSTPHAGKSGCGCDSLFEEVSQVTETEKDSDSVESFDALIQAALAAASRAPLPPDPLSLTSAVDAATTAATDPDAAGSLQSPAAAGQFLSDASDVAVSSADAADPLAAAQERLRQSEVQQGFSTAVEEFFNGSAGDAAAEPPSESTVEDGHSTDDVMFAVEEAMESFTPIPASVLALMRADSVGTQTSMGSMVSSGPNGQRPLAAGHSLPESLDANETEVTDGDLASLFSAAEFAAEGGAATDRFASTLGESTEDPSDTSDTSSPEASASPEQANQTPHVPFSGPGSSAPHGGHDRLPVVPATREAMGAFAFEQIKAHADSRDGEPVSRIEARIDPPELGRMSIEISRTSEGLSAHLSVEDPSVLALLDQQMKEVQKTLEAAGVPMTSLTMSAGSERDAPKEQSRGDDEELAFASPARATRPVGSRPTTTRREIDTTA